ncbi:MAG: hypothetical protein QM645_04235 [Asticcacaulis sp.]
MSTPITPSLSQMLRTHSARVNAAAAPVSDATSGQTNSFAQTLATIKKAPVAQAPVTQAPQTAPTVFKAADIARAEPLKPDEGRILRPGSLLNIRV